jgi:hypothetical protein
MIRQNFLRPLAVLLCALLASALPTHAMAKPKRDKNGFVQVLSTTVGADILIDGDKVGTVPFEEYIPLEAGDHTVELRLRGYTEFSKVVEVRAGKTIEIEADLIAVDGILQVETPGYPDATVAVDGQIIGSTPFDGLVAAGEHTVTVTAPGLRPFNQRLSIRAGESYSLKVDLQKDPRATQPLEQPTETTEEDSASGGTPVHKTWWFWTLIGVGVAGTATALALTLGPEDAKSLQAPADRTLSLTFP